jgi:hypothetical protein
LTSNHGYCTIAAVTATSSKPEAVQPLGQLGLEAEDLYGVETIFELSGTVVEIGPGKGQILVFMDESYR